MGDAQADAVPEDDMPPESPPQALDDDARSDTEQAVAARSDAIERGEGGREPVDAPGDFAGAAGTGGVVKNQGMDAQ